MGKHDHHHDLESGYGNNALYPNMMESPELRWAFVRKVYAILCTQLLLTVAVGAVVVFVPPIARFITETRAGLAVWIVLLILPFLLLLPLYFFHKKHPVNFLILGLFTISMAFAVGLSCSYRRGEVVLEAAILTAVVTVGLTLYTFWAAKRGKDFSFLGPFLFAAVLVLMVFGLIQFFFPLGRISLMIYGALGALIFSGYIIYDTDNMIKRYSYDDYIWASVSLYIDVINLFLSILGVPDAAE
ncbi:hypothetical protein MLD38_027308 [Melastoma candidum]|uniref:Uncharacterized protein n=1 Tax=Melastoma candidum TaxID=119954 RepID=A0ACB9P158_9MYRT|nr:hypothetical protein MLD38_027308 [Melastoma candidum]